MAGRISCAFVLAVVAATNLWASLTENVILVVIDGARYTETYGDDSHANIRHIWNDLRLQGTIFTRFYNNGKTETNPGHCSIVTGTWQDVNNDGGERPDRPTVFEYMRRELGSAVSECYVVLGKGKLDILTHSTHRDYGSQYAASVRTASDSYSDTQAWANLENVLAGEHPRLAILNLPATDRLGHLGNWNGYLDAIRAADSRIYELWNDLQADPFYSGKTALIVTNDHGRHTNEWQNHGCDCEGCRHIMLLTIGPDFAPGQVDSTERSLIDLAPTVGQLLGFDTPLAAGSPLQLQIPVAAGPLAPAMACSAGPDVVVRTVAGGARFLVTSPARQPLSLWVYGIDGALVYEACQTTQSGSGHVFFWDASRAASSSAAGRYVWAMRVFEKPLNTGAFTLAR